MDTQLKVPEPEPQSQISVAGLFALVNELTSRLKAPNQGLIRQIVSVMDEERARAILDQVLPSKPRVVQ